MRKLLYILLFTIQSFPGLAQTELVSAFNSTASGRYSSFALAKTINNHEMGIGLRYNIGMLSMPDDQGNLYYKRLYPSTFGQHFGLQIFYHYHILKKWDRLKPFLFLDLQGTFSTTRNVDFGQTEAKRYGPFTWQEQYLGIGFKVDLPKNFFITQKIGGGGMLIFGPDEILLKEEVAWEFGGILNFGVGYRFK